MKLKTFDKCNVAVKTEYTVWNAKGEFVESFTEDYLDTNSGRNGILKKIDYENAGAEVKHVSVNSATGLLSVSLVLK